MQAIHEFLEACVAVLGSDLAHLDLQKQRVRFVPPHLLDLALNPGVLLARRRVGLLPFLLLLLARIRLMLAPGFNHGRDGAIQLTAGSLDLAIRCVLGHGLLCGELVSSVSTCR